MQTTILLLAFLAVPVLLVGKPLAIRREMQVGWAGDEAGDEGGQNPTRWAPLGLHTPPPTNAIPTRTLT